MSEFRRDSSSGDWVIIAPGRAVRPVFLSAKRPPRKPTPKADCPFEHPEKTGNWPPVAALPSAKNWKIIVLPNKYPALQHGNVCSVPFRHGIYEGRTGIGSHELVVTRDHSKTFAELETATARNVFRALQGRCRAAAEDRCLVYVVPFHNWGPTAGASLWHPHYQILALPVVPGHTARSLAGAGAYFKEHHRCVRCDMIREEKKAKVRIVKENSHAIAIAPYASKVPFEIRIMPKKHSPYFYKTPTAVIDATALLLQQTLRALKKNVNDPDFNFFIHEAPLDGKNHEYHHWHVEILPRVAIQAGFEFSTGVYINIVPPEQAAAILRGEKKAKPDYH